MARQGRRLETPGTCRVVRRDGGVHRDAVTDSMLDPLAVGNGESSLLVLSSGRIWWMSHEDGPILRGALDGELCLEQPAFVAVLFGLRLLVAQEERDRPLVADPAHNPLDHDLGRGGVRRPEQSS